jgi:thiol-disulfide isomerase/thioredoxin
MKTLFFILNLLIGCGPTEVDVKEGPTTAEHTGTPEDVLDLEPVGVIPADDCRHVDIGDKACNFRLTDQNENTWELYEHLGDVIVLDFSTVWCPPCQAAGHYAQPIQDDYEDQGVQFVTVLIDGLTGEPTTEADINEWVDSHGITTAPVLQGSRDKMLDSTGSGTEGYLLSAFPTYIYIGRDMKFYSGHVGFSEEYVRQKIEEGL